MTTGGAGAVVAREGAIEQAEWRAGRRVNLSAYAGQTVAVRLQLTTDEADQRSLFLDVVAFGSAP